MINFYHCTVIINLFAKSRFYRCRKQEKERNQVFFFFFPINYKFCTKCINSKCIIPNSTVSRFSRDMLISGQTRSMNFRLYIFVRKKCIKKKKKKTATVKLMKNGIFFCNKIVDFVQKWLHLKNFQKFSLAFQFLVRYIFND